MLKASTQNITVLACEICLREIPRSVGRCCEGQDYVYYFCGDACYAQWTQTSMTDSPSIAIDGIEQDLSSAHALG